MAGKSSNWTSVATMKGSEFESTAVVETSLADCVWFLCVSFLFIVDRWICSLSRLEVTSSPPPPFSFRNQRIKKKNNDSLLIVYTVSFYLIYIFSQLCGVANFNAVAILEAEFHFLLNCTYQPRHALAVLSVEPWQSPINSVAWMRIINTSRWMETLT